MGKYYSCKKRQRNKKKRDRKEYFKEYYLKNKEKILDKHKEYYKKNREHKLNYNKEYYRKNIEHISNHKKDYREKNKEKLSDKHKEYYRKNRDKILQQHSELYYFYVENNICPICGKNAPSKGNKICDECLNRIAERSYKNKRVRDYTKDKISRKKLKDKRKEQGICVVCGRRPSYKNRIICIFCLVKERERSRIRYKSKATNIHEYREKNKLCYYCNEPRYRNFGVCEYHYKKIIETHEKNPQIGEYWRGLNRIRYIEYLRNKEKNTLSGG